MIITYFIVLAALKLMEDFLPRRGVFIGAAVGLSIVNIAALALTDPRSDQEKSGGIACLNENRDILERGVATEGLPIVVKSSRSWLPRWRYEHGNYIFPLDWDVVEHYPWKSRGNAADYHIMENFKTWATWANTRGIMTTKELLATYPEFLALEEGNYSWFDNLNRTTQLTTHVLKKGPICTLWRVEVNGPSAGTETGADH